MGSCARTIDAHFRKLDPLRQTIARARLAAKSCHQIAAEQGINAASVREVVLRRIEGRPQGHTLRATLQPQGKRAGKHRRSNGGKRRGRPVMPLRRAPEARSDQALRSYTAYN